MKSPQAFWVSLIAGLIVTGAILIADNRLAQSGSVPEPLEVENVVPAAQMRALDLIYDTSSLVGKYGVAALGALGFLISRRILPGDSRLALDRAEIIFISVSAFCAIMAIYFGVRTPVSLANQLDQNVLDLSAQGDVRTTMRLQVRSLLTCLMFLWGFAFYQMIAKRSPRPTSA